jgi:hypothetical protein
MSKQPEALRLADALDSAPYSSGCTNEAATELRRLHAVNAELLEALKLALSAHGRMLLSDPPQDAWKAQGVEEKARTAIKKAEEVKP